MREFLYSDYAVATGEDNQLHYITVVGQVLQDNIKEEKTDKVSVEIKKGCFVDGKLTYPSKHFSRTLTLAYSICHPEDEFDPKKGQEIAYKRLKTKPLGIATTEYVTMFQQEDLQAQVDAKLNYIADNIEKFIDRK